MMKKPDTIEVAMLYACEKMGREEHVSGVAALAGEMAEGEKRTPGVDEETPVGVREAVRRHLKVFEASKGLPPSRERHDHHITLQAGATPPFKSHFGCHRQRPHSWRSNSKTCWPMIRVT